MGNKQIEHLSQLENAVNRLKDISRILKNSNRWRIGDGIISSLNKLRRVNKDYDPVDDLQETTNSLTNILTEYKNSTAFKSDGQSNGTIDVIIPVHNALEDVKKCIQSVLQSRNLNRLILVNDGSDKVTTDYLEMMTDGSNLITLKQNKSPQGYTKAINAGIRKSTASTLILLNSDTVVPSNWIEKIQKCIHEKPDFGLMGPLSNAASYQSVPTIRDNNGDWEINKLPAGFSVDDMNDLIDETNTPIYPEVPIINGFCFIINRDLIRKIGGFDEENFPKGYGEENDYCIRALKNGFKNYIIDDLYVFHAKSKSFGHATRKQLAKSGSANLKSKWGKDYIKSLVNQLEESDHMKIVRKNISNKFVPYRELSDTPVSKTKKILYLLPVKGGSGGSHSVMQEVEAMRNKGYYVQVANRAQNRLEYNIQYADILKNWPDLVFYYKNQNHLFNYIQVQGFDLVIGTIYNSIKIIEKIANKLNVATGYYIQDYEPYFYEEETPDYNEAKNSYTLIKDNLLFAKTEWICREVEKLHSVKVQRVCPSLDHSVYYPSYKAHDDVSICAMIRPKTPRRGAERTMEVLKAIKLHKPGIKINIFGCPTDDPFLEKYDDMEFINHGILSRNSVSKLLRSNSIFLDLSDYQAFGRTGLEAMACGCVPVLPSVGGVHEYAVTQENSLIVDVFDKKGVLEGVESIINDHKLLKRLRKNAILKASEYSKDRAAISELLLFEEVLN